MAELSRSQIDKLGDRLRRGDSVSQEDLELLQRVRAAHDDALAEAARRLREQLGLEPTARLKTVQTIIEKLVREKTRLSTIQDIAGLRIVRNMNRTEQDQLVKAIEPLFESSKVVDRRATPSFGYRAVHVIVEVDRLFVEIQVRTELQNLWAQLLERLADRWGRQIRYGGAPDNSSAEVREGFTRQGVLDVLQQTADVIDEHESVAAELAEVQQADSPSARLGAMLRRSERIEASERMILDRLRNILG